MKSVSKNGAWRIRDRAHSTILQWPRNAVDQGLSSAIQSATVAPIWRFAVVMVYAFMCFGRDRALFSMKKIFVSQNLIEVEMRKEHLEQASIRCMVKNQRSSGLAGEIPFTEVFPELWVIQDEDYDRARQLLEEGLIALPSNQDTWVCAGCGERHESQFAECWKCGQERTSV